MRFASFVFEGGGGGRVEEKEGEAGTSTFLAPNLPLNVII